MANLAEGETTAVKAFLSGIGAAILIALIAAFALQYLDQSASEYYQAEHGNVRL